MSKIGRQIIEGLEEALLYARGVHVEGLVVHHPSPDSSTVIPRQDPEVTQQTDPHELRADGVVGLNPTVTAERAGGRAAKET